ncbi:MAG TPA: hypothetical protein VNZ54_10595 [bacterium]|nr:hypothetical protein [bacterium]
MSDLILGLWPIWLSGLVLSFALSAPAWWLGRNDVPWNRWDGFLPVYTTLVCWHLSLALQAAFPTRKSMGNWFADPWLAVAPTFISAWIKLWLGRNGRFSQASLSLLGYLIPLATTLMAFLWVPPFAE